MLMMIMPYIEEKNITVPYIEVKHIEISMVMVLMMTAVIIFGISKAVNLAIITSMIITRNILDGGKVP